MHQLKGRLLGFTLLQALKEALELWQHAGEFVADSLIVFDLCFVL